MVDLRQLKSYALLAAVLCLAIPWQYLSVVIGATPLVNQGLVMQQRQELSGVTGALFSGARTRAFKGRLFFKGNEQAKVFEDYAQSSSPSMKGIHKWAVCTTIHSPTQAILDFVDSEEWAIVIVGDKGMAPFRIDGSQSFFLDAAEQESLARQFPDLCALLPWKHFSRKNLGFLFAILHGAEQIWDFDDDNYLKEGLWPVFPDQSHNGHYRVVQGGDNKTCMALNPLPLMGGDNHPTPMWPRGFPLNLVRHPCNHTLAPAEDLSTVAVVQSLADHEPDVDGIYRLTRTTPMNFEAGSLPVQIRTLVVPHGTLSPYNAQATLVAKPAFWSLLLPISVHGRVSDIWRSYIGQRLLWDIGMNIAFVAPVVDQHRNPHNPLADMKAEEDLYYKSLELVRFLQTWEGMASTLQGRYEELIVALYERWYIEESDIYLAQQWLRALDHVGYDFPALAFQTSDII